MPYVYLSTSGYNHRLLKITHCIPIYQECAKLTSDFYSWAGGD